MAFAEYEDANWCAGGGYAWDVVRRDDPVCEAVNGWLGSDKLKIPYQLMVHSLVAVDQLKDPLSTGLVELEADEEAMYVGSVWDDFHERYLITDIIGVSVPAGFDITGKQDDWSTWGRLGREDKDKIQRLFDPATRSGSLKWRFSIGALVCDGLR